MMQALLGHQQLHPSPTT
uniref:Uncharacterized protein n=1 Tax=Arundo donax TaxID=35708 RepID=A0A0A9H0F4_ARUDO